MNRQLDSSLLGERSGSFPVWLLLCALVCSVLFPGQARAYPYVLGEQFASYDVLGGEYRVNNNVWGAATAQEVVGDTTGTGFEVVLSNHSNQPGHVAAYPFVQKGVHWGGTNTVDSGLPIRVGDVVSAPFEMSIDTAGVSGDWNAAYESFFSTAGGTPPDKAELMIWLQRQGDFTPAGTRVAQNVSIGGILWDVWYSDTMAWDHYIAYVLPNATDSLSDVSLDLKDFMDDCQSRGYLEPEWYLDNMEAGFEIIAGGQDLTLNSFSAAVNPIPEPASGMMAVLGWVLVAWCVRRR